MCVNSSEDLNWFENKNSNLKKKPFVTIKKNNLFSDYCNYHPSVEFEQLVSLEYLSYSKCRKSQRLRKKLCRNCIFIVASKLGDEFQTKHFPPVKWCCMMFSVITAVWKHVCIGEVYCSPQFFKPANFAATPLFSVLKLNISSTSCIELVCTHTLPGGRSLETQTHIHTHRKIREKRIGLLFLVMRTYVQVIISACKCKPITKM